ncbi:MAG: phosphoesterase [Planctomycetes bacterium]|nr:phosphoesterase [Planctomycetota bacterium]
MNAVPQEDVLVVPRAVLERAGMFQGFQADTAAYLPLLLDPRHTSWRPRAAVEEDPSFKQLIPYCVLAARGADGLPRYFAYTRGGGLGEARLRAKRSVGIGGHIASVDGAHGDDVSYDAGMRRELDEEVAIGAAFTSRIVGLINDDATPVGSVHLGIVHVLELERPDVAPRESGLVDCGFATLDALLADRERFETWSQIALDALREGRLA